MKANTRAFKERQVVLLSNPSPTKRQIGYVRGMEKALLPQDEQLTSDELRQMTQDEISSYIDFLKQMYHEQKTFSEMAI